MSLTIDSSLRRNRTPPWSDDLLLFEPVCPGRVLLPVLAEKVLRRCGNLIGGGKGVEYNAQRCRREKTALRDSAEKDERMQELTTAKICLKERLNIVQLNLCPLNL